MKQAANDDRFVAIHPTYAPLVLACARHGIGRTTAFQLAREGKLSVFKIGGRTFVRLDSLATLPERIDGATGEVA